MHIYTTYPAYSATGLPLSEYAAMQSILHLTTRNDWTESRKKTKEERLKLSNAKLSYGKFSRNPYFKEYKDELIKLFIHHKTPNFGSFKFTI